VGVVRGAGAARHGIYQSSAGWFRMPFYETDFGYGKPVFAGPADDPYNGCVLMLPGHVGAGSINVFVLLWKEDMEKLMADTEFMMVS
jgi:shikimate O-hydroxycinnamoyltransferase